MRVKAVKAKKAAEEKAAAEAKKAHGTAHVGLNYTAWFASRTLCVFCSILCHEQAREEKAAAEARMSAGDCWPT